VGPRCTLRAGSMDAGTISRLRMAVAAGTAAAAAAVALVASAGSAGAGEPDPEPLLPDLVVLRPADIGIVKSASKRNLVFSHTTANRGLGPLEISPDLSTTTCAEGGEDGRQADQFVYSDGNGSGFFERGADGEPGARSVGCMVYHPAHLHYHFKDFALYQLYRERTGRLVRTSDKTSFCVADYVAWDLEREGAAQDAAYGPENCATDDGTHGLSVGWADLYVAGTPGQELDVTGLRRGRYCFVAITDPEDRLDEDGTRANNVRQVRLGLRPGRGIAKRLNDPCRTPPPVV
jgi:hypothetical protein